MDMGVQVTHLAGAGSVSTGQTAPRDTEPRARDSPIPKVRGAEPRLAGGARLAQPRGYLDTVLQAVAHGRADLLEVTEQSG